MALAPEFLKILEKMFSDAGRIYDGCSELRFSQLHMFTLCEDDHMFSNARKCFLEGLSSLKPLLFSGNQFAK